MSKVKYINSRSRRRIRLGFTAIPIAGSQESAYVWDPKLLTLETLLLERFGLDATSVLCRWAEAVDRSTPRRSSNNAS